MKKTLNIFPSKLKNFFKNYFFLNDDAYLKKGFQLISTNGKNKLLVLIFISSISALLDLVGIGLVIPLLLSVAFGSNEMFSAIIPEQFIRFSEPSFVIILFTFFISVKVFISVYVVYYRSETSYMISADLSHRLVRALIKKPNLFHIKFSSGTASRLAIVECHNFAQSFITPIVVLFSEGICLIAIFLFLLTIDPIFSSVIMVFFITTGFLFRQVTKNRISQASFNRANSDEKRVNLIETFSSISLETSRKPQRKWLNRLYEISNNNSRDASAAYLFWSNLAKPYLETLIYFLVIIFVAYSIFLTESVSSSKLSELILFFVLAAVRSLPSSTRVISAMSSMRYSESSINQISSNLDMVNGSDDGTLNKVVYVNESDLNVEVNNYRVKLDDAQLTKIDDFCINRKGLIYVDGPSGSGKSSFFNHLAGIRDDFLGSIEISHNCSEGNKIISYCPQKVFLISGTLKENVFLGLDPTESQLELLKKYSGAFNLNNFINSDDYDITNAMVRNFGLEFSGGQRQRIAILRGLLSSSRIILFDEPLASLDKEYRNYLIDMLFELSKTKIIFISSHVDRELLMQSADSVIKTEIINSNV